MPKNDTIFKRLEEATHLELNAVIQSLRIKEKNYLQGDLKKL